MFSLCLSKWVETKNGLLSSLKTQNIMKKTVKTFYVTYKDLNGLEQVETVEAYNEMWAKALFRTMFPFCTIISVR